MTNAIEPAFLLWDEVTDVGNFITHPEAISSRIPQLAALVQQVDSTLRTTQERYRPKKAHPAFAGTVKIEVQALV